MSSAPLRGKNISWSSPSRRFELIRSHVLAPEGLRGESRRRENQGRNHRERCRSDSLVRRSRWIGKRLHLASWNGTQAGCPRCAPPRCCCTSPSSLRWCRTYPQLSSLNTRAKSRRRQRGCRNWRTESSRRRSGIRRCSWRCPGRGGCTGRRWGCWGRWRGCFPRASHKTVPRRCSHPQGRFEGKGGGSPIPREAKVKATKSRSRRLAMTESFG